MLVRDFRIIANCVEFKRALLRTVGVVYTKIDVERFEVAFYVGADVL